VARAVVNRHKINSDRKKRMGDSSFTERKSKKAAESDGRSPRSIQRKKAQRPGGSSHHRRRTWDEGEPDRKFETEKMMRRRNGFCQENGAKRRAGTEEG